MTDFLYAEDTGLAAQFALMWGWELIDSGRWSRRWLKKGGIEVWRVAATFRYDHGIYGPSSNSTLFLIGNFPESLKEDAIKEGLDIQHYPTGLAPVISRETYDKISERYNQTWGDAFFITPKPAQSKAFNSSEVIVDRLKEHAASLRRRSERANSFDPGFSRRHELAFAADEIEKLLREIEAG